MYSEYPFTLYTYHSNILFERFANRHAFYAHRRRDHSDDDRMNDPSWLKLDPALLRTVLVNVSHASQDVASASDPLTCLDMDEVNNIKLFVDAVALDELNLSIDTSQLMTTRQKMIYRTKWIVSWNQIHVHFLY